MSRTRIPFMDLRVAEESADVDAAISVVEALSALLLQHPEIVEADLNPVRIHARGQSVAQGATVLDALFVVA